MTDKEIIKALECIQPRILTEKERMALDNALDLINRQQAQLEYLQGERETLLEDIKASSNQVIEQQAEIEKLNVELVGMRGACNSYKMHYDNAKAEIEKLERVTSYLEGVCESTPDKVRAEAIKEFAERLKKQIFIKKDKAFYSEKIDSLVKEMVGETDV